jgi:Ca-activated chloride channel family protein
MMADRPWLLWTAPLFGLLVGLLAWGARRTRVRAAVAWSPALGRMAALSGRRSPALLGAAALLMAVGMSGPRWGLASRAAESRAINVVLVMDVSKSMLATDAVPDRLTRAIQVARRLVQDLSGDRLGLVAFAARPYLMSPLTLDQTAIALQLDALDPTMASEGGSALGAALTLAHQVLTQASEGGDRAVVVLTDGESFDGEAAVTAAAGKLVGDHIALVTVPLGGIEGARIPEPDGSWHLDQLGNQVITRRDDVLLRAMTEAAHGELIAADAPDPAGDVRGVLDRLDRAAVRDQLAADLVPRGWLFGLAALAVLVIQAITRRTAALVALALVAAPALHAQRPTAAAQLLRHGDTTAALPALVAAAKQRGGDTVWYNAGTAALMQGDLATAFGALERATGSLDPDLRRRALYNLGTAQLLAARRDSTGRDSLLTRAAANLQSALAVAPRDLATKYNYELARRMMRPPPPPTGGGGQGPPPPPPPGSPPPSRGSMGESEAEQVLNAMERAERQTRQDLARKQRRGEPPIGPDW